MNQVPETFKQFVAALHHADWTRQGIDVAGSEFNHRDVVDILYHIELLMLTNSQIKTNKELNTEKI
jgi:hypothetical protein